MEWGPLILMVIPPLLTFVLGLFSNKPGYKKGKEVIATINKAIADDKIDSSEVEEFMDHFRKDEE